VIGGAADTGTAEGHETAARGRTMVGRERELKELRLALTDARAGHGAFCLLTGEVGIGKTRLAEALASEAGLAGMRVAWGRCWTGGGAPAYWPWIEVLGRLDPAAETLLGGSPAGEVDPPPEPASARFGLFRKVTERLAAMAAEGPLLLAIDDLQAADAPSLLLLGFIARRVSEMPAVILATSRESAADEDQRGLLDDLTAAGRRIPLGGLAEAETGRLVEHHLGHSPGRGVVHRICTITEGNPLFVEEVSRLRAAQTSAGLCEAASLDVAIPRSVLETIGARVDAMRSGSTDVLGVAAVAGREFDADVLADVAGLSAAEVASQLRRGVGAGVVVSTGGRRYRFTHELLRQVLSERLDPSRRAGLHLRFARLLEAGREPHAPVSELAHHYRCAVPAADVGLAIDWSLQAARASLGALAYEEAAAHAQSALRLDPAGPAQAELLLVLGTARWASGEGARARQPIARAFALARDLGTPDLLARAALAFGGGAGGWASRSPDPALVEMLREAVKAEPAPRLEAQLLARLGEERLQAGVREEASELTRRALVLARESADDAALSRALDARLLTTLRSTSRHERSAFAAELQGAAERCGSAEARHKAFLWQLNLALERADHEGVQRARAGLSEVVGLTRQPHQLWSAEVTEGMLALLDGRLDTAERHIERAPAVAEGVVPTAPQMQGVQLIALRREQGRLAELEPVIRGVATAPGGGLSRRCAWIGMLCELGRDDEARRELALLPAQLPAGDDWVAAVLMLAEICWRLQEPERASGLYSALVPYADEVAVVSFSVLCRGATDRYLGLLAATAGRYADAETHFDAAQRLHAGLESALWTARTEVDRAAVRSAAGDRTGARRAAEAALGLADDRGLVAIADRARRLLGRIDTGDTAAVRPPVAREVLVFVHDQGLWEIGAADALIRLPDARGLGYIAELLAHPGEERFAAELAGVLVASEQPVLDPIAKAAYRSRLTDLRVEIEAAERFGDHERGARVQAELDALTTELSRAVGLRGHDRRLSAPAERARSSVTKAIRAAIRRITERDTALGQHLDVAIRTGTFCSYQPDARHPIDWRVTM
jgi:tetratricopeptide (TPR) repeat protein